jgi:ABC-type transport system substrate-binding protein
MRFGVVVSQPVPRVMDILVNQLKAVGVELTPEPADNAAARARMTRGDYEWGIVSAGGLVGDAGPDRLRLLYSSRLPKSTFASVRGWKNDEYDELADRQLGIFDEAERKRMVGRMQQILGAEVPMLALYYPNLYFIVRKTVFDQWYFTPGGYSNGGFGINNRHVLITGLKSGLSVRSSK